MSAAVRHLETDANANQDISSAVAVGAYTADADRLVVAQVFADEVAGNGDYVLYATLQIAGAGSHYRFIPITTAAAASGLTAIAAQAVSVGMRSGDVLTVWIDGLAGDTTTPDTVVRFFEHAALRPTVADRTLDIDASNEIVNLSGTLASLQGGHASILTLIDDLDDITEAQVQAIIDAHDAAQDAEHDATQAAIAGLSIPTSADIADVVLDELLSEHTIPGSVGEGISDAGAASATPEEVADEVWANAPSTVTAVLVTGLSAGTLTLLRGDRWDFTLNGMQSLDGATDVVFTIKKNKSDDDSDALVQIRKTAGLTVINRTAAGAASGNGVLTTPDEFSTRIIVEGIETAKLHPEECHYDVQRVGAASDPVTRAEGVVLIKADVTRAVV